MTATQTVKQYGEFAVTAAKPAVLAVIGAGDLAVGEVDFAAEAGRHARSVSIATGRTLARPLARGQSVRTTHLKAREWFAAGETVQVVAQGPGFRVSGEAQALTQGVEGQEARVKTEGGRVLTGRPIGERRLEVSM